MSLPQAFLDQVRRAGALRPRAAAMPPVVHCSVKPTIAETHELARELLVRLRQAPIREGQKLADEIRAQLDREFPRAR